MLGLCSVWLESTSPSVSLTISLLPGDDGWISLQLMPAEAGLGRSEQHRGSERGLPPQPPRNHQPPSIGTGGVGVTRLGHSAPYRHLK